MPVRPAALLAAAGASCLLACSSGVAGTGSVAAPAPAGRSSSAPPASSGSTPSPTASGRKPVSTKAVQGPGGRSYVIQIWAEHRVTNCAAHAYGPIVKFLRAHPCTSMDQLLATTTVNGRPVGFAQRAIVFGSGSAGYRTAGQFRAMVSRNGTGNLNDLLREGERLPSGPRSVPFPNAFSALAQDNQVTVVEAWYLHGPTPDNDPALVRMCNDIFLRF
jgi:hypothetical protein